MIISEQLKKILTERNIDYNNHELKNLALPGITLTLENIQEIVSLYPYIEQMDINTTNIGDEECFYVGKLSHLTWLDISGNSAISDKGIKELCNLTHLTWLDISLSRLTDACVNDLLRLQDLELLLISATALSVYCLEKFKGLPKLKTLDLVRSDAGNKLPYNLVNSKDAQEILNFISVKNEEQVPIGNYRLMLLGEPGCGKTTIYSKLSGDFRKETSTLGINIKALDSTLAGDDMKDVRLNIWDFGGQDYQTQIHEIFLSENCIFTIVVEPRMNDTAKSFKRWYDLIKKFVNPLDKNSFPIIVLFSKVDNLNGGLGYLVSGDDNNNRIEQEIREIIKEDLDNQGTNSINDDDLNIVFIKSSAVEEGGLDEYKEVIKKALISSYKDSKILVNKETALLANEIVSGRNNELYLSYETVETIYNNIIKKYKIENPLTLEHCLMTLDYYGDILYKRNTNYVFTNPNRLIGFIYDLLISTEYEKKHKKLNFKTPLDYINARILNKIQNKFSIDDEHFEIGVSERLLDMLSNANLIVSIGNNEYLIPTRSHYMELDNVYKIIEQNNSTSDYNMEGARHFVIALTCDSKTVFYKLEALVASNLSKNKELEDILAYGNAFIIKSKINSKKEMAILYSKSLNDEIDIYITPGSVEQGLFLQFVIALNTLIYGGYKLLSVCPCKGRLKDECTYRYDLAQLKKMQNDDINFRIHCLESHTSLSLRSFLNTSIIDTSEAIELEESIDNDIFVIMPFGRNEEEIAKYDLLYNAIIKAKEKANIVLDVSSNIKERIGKVVRVDKLLDNGSSVDQLILRYIEKSSIIVTLLINSRPNCLYEYGMARTYVGKTFITYNYEGDEAPFDVRNHQIYKLHKEDEFGGYSLFIKDLAQKLVLAIKEKYEE